MTYRWGIIGPGNIAQTFADALRHLSQGELYAIASRDPHRASQFAQKNGAEVTYDSYQALLEDPNVDIVYIATPHSHHFPVAMRSATSPFLILPRRSRSPRRSGGSPSWPPGSPGPTASSRPRTRQSQ